MVSFIPSQKGKIHRLSIQSNLFFNNLRIMHIINFNISVIFIKVIQTMCVLKIAIMKYDALGKKTRCRGKRY